MMMTLLSKYVFRPNNSDKVDRIANNSVPSWHKLIFNKNFTYQQQIIPYLDKIL